MGLEQVISVGTLAQDVSSCRFANKEDAVGDKWTVVSFACLEIRKGVSVVAAQSIP